MGLGQAHGYTHTQDTPSNSWTISHNLGYKPIVSVTISYNGADTIILPKNIAHTDDFTTVVSFSDIHTGTARCM